MRDEKLTFEAGCIEALEFLRSIEGRLKGSAYNRMLVFRQLTSPGGEIDHLCRRLSQIVHPEINVCVPRPKGAILALGHLDVAKQLLHETVKASPSVYNAMDESSDKAILHLQEAIESVKR